MSARVEVVECRNGSAGRAAWEEARRRLCEEKSVGSKSEPGGDWLDSLAVEE